MTNKHASSRYQEDPRIFCLQKLTSSCRQCLHSCSEVKQTSIRLRGSSSALRLQEVTTIIDMTRMMRRNAWTVKKRKKKRKTFLCIHSGASRRVASREIMGDHQYPENTYDVPRVPGVCTTASRAQLSFIATRVPAPASASCQRPRPRRCLRRRNDDDTSQRACERWLPQLTAAAATTAAATPRNRARGTRWRRRRDAAPRSHRCESWSLDNTMCVSLL